MARSGGAKTTTSTFVASLLVLVMLLMVSGTAQADMDSEQLTIMLQVADAWPVLKTLSVGAWTQANLQSCVARGVLCTSLGYVGRINLEFDTQVNGTIPSSLGSLFCLSSFSVQSPTLYGPIPSSLGTLDFLTEFSAPNARLSGSIPTLRSGLQRFHAGFDGAVVAWNTGCLPSSLISLELSNINFGSNNPIPAEIFSMTSLESLEMRTITFDGSMPDLFSLTTLSSFSIVGSDNMSALAAPSSGGVPSDWSALSALSIAYLESLPWGGSLPSSLSPTVQNFYVLNLPHITGTISPELFSGSRRIVYLADLPGVTGDVPAPSNFSPDLERISLIGLGLNGQLNSSLLLAPALKSFSLFNVPSMPLHSFEWPSEMNCSILEEFLVYVSLLPFMHF